MLDLETRFRVRLASYIDGSISLHELRAWIAAEITDESVKREGPIPLYRPVMTHIAMFGVGDWPESDLRAAIEWHIASIDGDRPAASVPMMDAQWIEIMKSGRLPWPVVYTNPPAAVEGEREEPGYE
jgi:hypothetical protein